MCNVFFLSHLSYSQTHNLGYQLSSQLKKVLKWMNHQLCMAYGGIYVANYFNLRHSLLQRAMCPLALRFHTSAVAWHLLKAQGQVPQLCTSSHHWQTNVVGRVELKQTSFNSCFHVLSSWRAGKAHGNGVVKTYPHPQAKLLRAAFHWRHQPSHICCQSPPWHTVTHGKAKATLSATANAHPCTRTVFFSLIRLSPIHTNSHIL